jgi:hypothetical protein
LALIVPAALAMAGAACARLDTTSKVDVRPIEVKPIHITVDVNVRVDHELNNFFAFEDQPGTTKPAAAAANPTSQPSSAPAAAPASEATTQQTGA